MDTDQQAELTKLEAEFSQEIQGEGSLIPDVDGQYAGFDIHPEDIDVIFFEGIGVPRYASIEVDDLDEKNAAYMECYHEAMTKFPLIGRANDTMVGARYSLDEIGELLAECNALVDGSADEKATRAAKKLLIAAMKAEASNAPLTLTPRM